MRLVAADVTAAGREKSTDWSPMTDAGRSLLMTTVNEVDTGRCVRCKPIEPYRGVVESTAASVYTASSRRSERVQRTCLRRHDRSINIRHHPPSDALLFERQSHRAAPYRKPANHNRYSDGADRHCYVVIVSAVSLTSFPSFTSFSFNFQSIGCINRHIKNSRSEVIFFIYLNFASSCNQ